MLFTHVHGAHFLDVPYLRDKWGTQVWTLREIAEICEHPDRYDYAAMIPAYQAEFGCCIHGRIDGRLIAFTGPSISRNSSRT